MHAGIDVAKCNVVVCFDRPPNLKSFVQRRGRARKALSKYVIMFEDDGSGSNATTTWLKLEEEMRQVYMDEKRKLQELQALEDVEEEGERELTNKSTGAKLTLDDAVQHLYHFCATLPAAPYVDLRPIFTFNDASPSSDVKSISAKVLLPNSVDASVREASGTSQWKTEKMAKREAAFEAYANLYRAGLVNHNFLPLGHGDENVDEAYTAIEKRPSLVEVQEQFNPWLFVAQDWQKSDCIRKTTIKIREGNQCIAEMLMLLPCTIPIVYDFDLHWNAITTYQATFEPSLKAYESNVREDAAQATTLLLRSQFDSRMDADRSDFVALFVPPNVDDLCAWAEERSGTIKAEDLRQTDIDGGNAGLVRNLAENGRPHAFHDVRYTGLEDLQSDGPMDIDQDENMDEVSSNGADVMGESPTMDKCVRDLSQSESTNRAMDVDECEEDEGLILLEVTRLPKKVDFLHHTPEQDAKLAKESTLRKLLIKHCVMDRLPFTYSRFAGFIPSILHKVQVAMIVHRLCATVLSPLQLRDIQLVATAIAAPSALEGSDYNRLEFRGDSCLKFFTSLVLMAGHLNYHEGILSHKKDHIVSNSSLATAALHRGVAPFILTKSFTGNKGRPIYIADLLQGQSIKPREMSSKTLADVIEALIGAAYLEGTEKALACLEIFLPDVSWSTALRAHEILYETYDQRIPPSGHLVQVEQLIAYEFNLKLLLVEALTHPSHHGPNSSASYQRLEFLGDSVLDNVVTTTAFAHKPSIAIHNLHLVRAAFVNGHFLGFLCLTLFNNHQRADPVAQDPESIYTVRVSYPFYLWQAMRHASPAIRSAQQACLARCETVQTEIAEALANGTSYPWSLLARLEPPKFFSDIIESLLGAIYIDTHGSLARCESFLERLGLMAYLRRAMQDRIAMLHPKEELGQLSNQDTVKYVMGKEGAEGNLRLTCTVMLGDTKVVSVGDGLSSMDVQTRAAGEACKILRREGRRIRNNMGYSNQEAEDGVQVEGEAEDVEREGGPDQEMTDDTSVGYDSDEYTTADE